MNQSDIQKFIVKTLKTNAEFNTYCFATIGKTLNFYRDSSIRETVETLPYLVAHKFHEDNDLEGKEIDTVFVVQIIVAIEVDNKAVLDEDEISVFPSSDNVEKIVKKAIPILKCALRDLGITTEDGVDKNIRFTKFATLITEVGESTVDIQAVVTLTLEKYNFL